MRAQVTPHTICMPGSLIWIVEAKSAYYQYRTFGIVKTGPNSIAGSILRPFVVALVLIFCAR
jgi:hypothetical protein